MVEPQRTGADEIARRENEPGTRIHARADLDMCAAGIDDMKRAAVMVDIGPLDRQAMGLEMRLHAVEILVEADAKADKAAGCIDCLLQHKAVVAGLLQAAQVEPCRRLVADGKAERIDIEGAAAREVAHSQDDVARARKIEGRMLVGLWQGGGGIR